MNLTLLLLIGLAGWIAWRMYGPTAGDAIRRRAELREPPRRASGKSTPSRREEITALEKDPETGVYRPRERKR